MAEDAKALIELATRRFLEEVPALAPMKLVVGVELRGRGDVQHFRLEMPEIKVVQLSRDDKGFGGGGEAPNAVAPPAVAAAATSASIREW